MIQHIFKLIWNRRRSLAWIFVEQILVFGVILLYFIFFANHLSRHFSEGNMRIENMSFISFSSIQRINQTEEEKVADNAKFHNLLEHARTWQTVDLVSFNRMGAIPVMADSRNDSIDFRGNRYLANIRFCDENYYRMFAPRLSAGEWFRDADAYSDMPSAVVTQHLAERLEMTGNIIGQTVEFRGITYRITGVVSAFKARTQGRQEASLFLPSSNAPNNDWWLWQYVVKHKPGMKADFSKALIEEFYRNFPRELYQPTIMDFDKMSENAIFMSSYFILYFTGLPTAFLLIFAFMGTFGVVWMQSKKRMDEFGLRIALGSTPNKLMLTVIIENLILTTIAMLPGLIVVALLYAYSPEGGEWPAAIGAAVVTMWLFSVISAWYPARKAAKVQPVEALKAGQ